MHLLFTNLLAAAFLIHALLGCCRHHAFTCSPCKAVAESSPAKSCCHHRPASNDQQAPVNHKPCQYECQGHCVYLPTDKVQVDEPVDGPIAEIAAANAVMHSQFASQEWEPIGTLPDSI